MPFVTMIMLQITLNVIPLELYTVRTLLYNFKICPKLTDLEPILIPLNLHVYIFLNDNIHFSVRIAPLKLKQESLCYNSHHMSAL